MNASDWDLVKSEQISILGNGKESKNCTSLICLNLTPWQESKLLEICIKITTSQFTFTNKVTGELFFSTTHALKMNLIEIQRVNAIIDNEQIKCLRHE